MPRGFTIIETLLYIAIFSLILVAGIGSAYNLMEATSRFNQNILVESEANFLLRKFSLSLENVSVVVEPNVPGTPEPLLSVTRDNSFGTLETLTFSVSSGQMMMQRDASPVVALTTARVVVDNFSVDYQDSPVDEKSGIVIVSFEINDKPFSISRILRTDTT